MTEELTAGIARGLRAFALSSAAIATSLIPVAAETVKQRAAREEREYQAAYAHAAGLLMTSETATRPRPSTVRRMLRLLGRNGPRTRGALIQVGPKTYAHPTKGARRG